MSDISKLVGVKVKSTTACDTEHRKAPRDRTITETYGPNAQGNYIAWAQGESGGEHIIASSPEELIRRVMSLT